MSDETRLAFWRSSRLFVAAMCFLILFFMQSLRLNMSVAIVCMVNNTALLEAKVGNDILDKNLTTLANEESVNALARLRFASGNETNWNMTGVNSSVPKSTRNVSRCDRHLKDETEEERENGPLVWTKSQQGLVLNSYFWGMVVFLIPCGWMTNRYSPVKLLGISTILSSIFCLLIPVVAPHSLVGVVVLRVLTGCLSGLSHPAAQNLLAKWLLPSQLGTMGCFAFSGTTCGTIGVFIFAGYMCKYGFAGGWPSVFYVNGAAGLAMSATWLLFVHEYPSEALSRGQDRKPCVTRQCRQAPKSEGVPWKAMFTSKPVWAIFVCTCAIDIYGVITTLYLPTYFDDVMLFSVTSNGVMSSLPYVFKMLVQFSGGVLTDLLVKMTCVSVEVSRKVIVATGKFVCALSIILLGFMTCEQVSLAVVLMNISLAATGFIEVGPAINTIDIAGPLSGVIVGIACFFSFSVALAAASITSALISENATQESWQIVFSMSAGVVLASLVIYLCFASGQRQPWAKSVSKSTEDHDVVLVKERSPKEGAVTDLDKENPLSLKPNESTDRYSHV